MRKAMGALLLAAWMLLGACALAQPVAFAGVSADQQTREIDFGARRIRDIDGLCAFLDQLPQVESVLMYGSPLTDEQMEMLFARYPDIFFGWTVEIGDHIVRTDATAFSTLHGTNPKPPHTSEDFEKLKYCRKLLALDIGHNHVKDIGFLAHLPQLRVLILACNRVEDVSVLARLKDLEYIELFSNKITDYAPLANLDHLLDLNVKNNPCKDLTPLHGLTGLERFWAGCYISIPATQIKAMETALPACQYEWRDMPTLGGWREHPRYFVIRDMFRSGAYMPFAD